MKGQALLLLALIVTTSADDGCDRAKLLGAEETVLSRIFAVIEHSSLYRAERCVSLEAAVKASAAVLNTCHSTTLVWGNRVASKPFSYLYKERSDEFQTVYDNLCSGTFMGNYHFSCPTERIREILFSHFTRKLSIDDEHTCREMEKTMATMKGLLQSCDESIASALQPFLKGMSSTGQLVCTEKSCNVPYAMICLQNAKKLLFRREAMGFPGNEEHGKFCSDFKDLLATVTTHTIHCLDGTFDDVNARYNWLRPKFDRMCKETLKVQQKCEATVQSTPRNTAPTTNTTTNTNASTNTNTGSVLSLVDPDALVEAIRFSFIFDDEKVCNLSRACNASQNMTDYVCPVVNETACFGVSRISSLCARDYTALSAEWYDCFGRVAHECPEPVRYELFYTAVFGLFVTANKYEVEDFAKFKTTLTGASPQIWPASSTEFAVGMCLARMYVNTAGFCSVASSGAKCIGGIPATMLDGYAERSLRYLSLLTKTFCEDPDPGCSSAQMSNVVNIAFGAFSPLQSSQTTCPSANSYMNTLAGGCANWTEEKAAAFLEAYTVVCPNIVQERDPGCSLDNITSCFDELLRENTANVFTDVKVCIEIATGNCTDTVKEEAQLILTRISNTAFAIAQASIVQDSPGQDSIGQDVQDGNSTSRNSTGPPDLNCTCDALSAVVCYGHWHHGVSPKSHDSCGSLAQSEECANNFLGSCQGEQLEELEAILDKIKSDLSDKWFQEDVLNWKID